MKNLRKILRALFVFFIMSNSVVYAKTEMLSQEKFDIKKTVVLGAGIFLVVQILFISYKLDKEPNKKRVNPKNKKKENHIVKQDSAVQQDFKAQKEDKDLFVKLKLEKVIETLSNDEIKKQELEKQKSSQKKVVEITSRDKDKKKDKEKDIVKINEKKEPKTRDIKEIEETRKKIIRMVEEARHGAVKVTEETKKEAIETKKETRKKPSKIAKKLKEKNEDTKSKTKDKK